MFYFNSTLIVEYQFIFSNDYRRSFQEFSLVVFSEKINMVEIYFAFFSSRYGEYDLVFKDLFHCSQPIDFDQNKISSGLQFA
ncbi:hypothetical protein Echvi_1960 [Echinicola vietnamensis DSM 17526]|uniref:Uncharacterized protein n=1 Tax=Echinicola vietnamensis (strain DSM 17526 / LMG 23754 / KMM 6221) TaxID=926556 RepID=L0FWD4_ECHVK|nr:hypothetical protein Echvi_1960 [Echinicola vietnamensis DSM 17526]